ncbi:MAG: hypothetical protein V2J62_04735 [candidate division KSB1 bacterium]|nr:hypothetical protein [candidate division KSB1 bacterium]
MSKKKVKKRTVFTDIVQNIFAWNYQNYQSALSKGRALSIGEQVNFMKPALVSIAPEFGETSGMEDIMLTMMCSVSINTIVVKLRFIILNIRTSQRTMKTLVFQP